MEAIVKTTFSNAFNTLRPIQNGRHFPDDIFEYIFLNEIVLLLIKISLKFVPKCSINNIPSLVQIMAWHRPGDKPFSEPMMVCFPVFFFYWISFCRVLWRIHHRNGPKPLVQTMMIPFPSAYMCHGPVTRYVNLQVADAPGMPGTFSPAADFKGNR